MSFAKIFSTVALYVMLQKMFLTSKFSYLLFFFQPARAPLGIANRWKTINNNPPGSIKLSNQVFLGWKNARPKTILLSQTSMFWLFFIQFSFAKSHTILLSQTSMFWLFFIQFSSAKSHTTESTLVECNKNSINNSMTPRPQILSAGFERFLSSKQKNTDILLEFSELTFLNRLWLLGSL